MKYHIGYYTFNLNGKKVREYFISEPSGLVVAGDFKYYNAAKSYLTTVLLKQPTRTS